MAAVSNLDTVFPLGFAGASGALGTVCPDLSVTFPAAAAGQLNAGRRLPGADAGIAVVTLRMTTEPLTSGDINQDDRTGPQRLHGDAAHSRVRPAQKVRSEDLAVGPQNNVT